MPLDLPALWNHADPAGSEARFRALLPTAGYDDALILWTQIARTWGLRRDFERARHILATEVEPRLDLASAEVRVRHMLELGRTWASATHTPEQRADTRELARAQYTRAFEAARAARLDDLAVDALHMMVMVDETPEQQLAWNQRALAFMEASDQPAARRWAASLYNNVGLALHQAGRLGEADAAYRRSLAEHEAAGRPAGVRIAWWMIASNLRALGRADEALAIQLRLERECDAAGAPDPYVFEELEALYRANGDAERAAHYAARFRQVSGR